MYSYLKHKLNIGLKHYATLFNVGQLASPVGSYILNVKVAGLLYDREALKGPEMKNMNRDSVKELTCIGPSCFRLSFVILACVSYFGAAVSIVLVMRTRDFYRGDIYKKFRVEEKVVEEVEIDEGGGNKRKNEGHAFGSFRSDAQNLRLILGPMDRGFLSEPMERNFILGHLKIQRDHLQRLVYESRHLFGEILATESPVDCNVMITVPDFRVAVALDWLAQLVPRARPEWTSTIIGIRGYGGSIDL
ncbi:hypothetical protein LguiA_030336 [Lonicera macranthoides]